VQTPQRHSVNERQMAFDQGGERILRALSHVALQQIGVCQTAGHSIFIIPAPVRKTKIIFCPIPAPFALESQSAYRCVKAGFGHIQNKTF
jgi:hypothetical protein